MRRAMLLIVGLGTGGMLFVLLLLSAAEQYAVVQAQEMTQSLSVSLPCRVNGTQMQAIALVSYEGPFWEDGSDEEVAGVAALLVKNSGDLHLAQGAVILEWKGTRMVFELSAIPPGTQVLVLEKDKAAFRQDLPENCYGWAREEYPEYNGAVVTKEGGVLTVTNVTQCMVPLVTVRYKNYDAASDMFIGGITYTAEAAQLLPGEARAIAPYHYAYGYSRVVSITTAVVE